MADGPRQSMRIDPRTWSFWICKYFVFCVALSCAVGGGEARAQGSGAGSAKAPARRLGRDSYRARPRIARCIKASSTADATARIASIDERILPRKDVEIPDIAKPVTVTLKDGDTQVYVIGISHVSSLSVQQTEALIESIKPDAVMLELCLARCGQLIREEDNLETGRDDRAFYIAGNVKIEGIPKGDGFPTEEELLEWIGADFSPGQPLVKPNFDQLVENLLGTGIFSSVRIQADPPPPSSVPLYVSRRKILYKVLPKRTYIPWELDEDAPKELFPVYPLGNLILNCTERTGMLATLSGADVLGDIPEGLENLEEDALKWFQETKSTVRTFMKIRKAILDKQPNSKIAFEGGDRKKVTIRIKNQGTKVKVSNSGLEPTVYDGSGLGIMPFTREGSSVPKAPGAEGDSEWLNVRNVDWKLWEDNKIKEAPKILKDYINNPVASKLGEFLISRFGKFQDKAARKAKIKPGAAWQAAFASAVTTGSKLLVLGDELALVTQAELAKKLFQRMLFWVVASLGVFGVGVATNIDPTLAARVADLTQVIGKEDVPLYIAGLGAAILAVGWSDLYSPVSTMQSFARKKGQVIEDELMIQKPLELTTEPYYLPGEDSLLNWPGAKEIVLERRNEFMADTLFRMSRGLPARCPAYVTFENSDTKDALERMLMGEGENCDTNPTGVGLGTYANKDLKKVVAVVGTAHIHGIREEFERLKKQNPRTTTS